MNYKEMYSSALERNKQLEGRTIVLPETDDILALCRAGVPELIKRAITLAVSSNKVSEVVAVLSELADRGYGKPQQSMDIKSTVDITHKTSDTDRAILEQYYHVYKKEPKCPQTSLPQLQ